MNPNDYPDPRDQDSDPVIACECYTAVQIGTCNENCDRLSTKKVEPIGKDDPKYRYPMSSDQPAQIDCRVSSCVFYKGAGKCANVSPAITLNESGAFTCWSKKERKPAEWWQIEQNGLLVVRPEIIEMRGQVEALRAQLISAGVAPVEFGERFPWNW